MRKALLLAILALALAAPAAAGQTAAKCEANKLKTAGKYGQCFLKVLARAAKKRTSEADHSRCDSKFEKKWEKIEAKGGCAKTGDAPAVAGAVADHPGAITSLVGASSVSAGWGHTCASDSSGAAGCWGYDEYGQASPPAGNFTQVSAGGYQHSCAISDSGELLCWGGDSYGALSPPAGSFTQISVGLYHGCVINGSGELLCWGWDEHGQASPTAGNAVEVSAGMAHSCAIDSAGALVCWGAGTTDSNCDYPDWDCGQASPPAGNFTAVATGVLHSCAIDSAGALQCWGDNGSGQASPPAGNFTQVAAGHYHSCAIDSSGELACWGAGTTGTIACYHPAYDCGQARPPEGSFVALTAGKYHSCGIDVSGRVRCWGHDGYGQSSPPLLFRCWSGPLKVTGKYGACRLKAEAKAVKKESSADHSKCELKFTEKWAAAASRESSTYTGILDFGPLFEAEATGYGDTVAAIVACNDVECLSAQPNYPGWQDDPGGYEFTASMTPLVLRGQERQGGVADLLAAIGPDGTVRGLATRFPLPPWSPYYDPPEDGVMCSASGWDFMCGGYSFDIQLRSNAAGDLLSFKFYDAAADTVHVIDEDYSFVINDILGNAVDPHLLNIPE